MSTPSKTDWCTSILWSRYTNLTTDVNRSVYSSHEQSACDKKRAAAAHASASWMLQRSCSIGRASNATGVERLASRIVGIQTDSLPNTFRARRRWFEEYLRSIEHRVADSVQPVGGRRQPNARAKRLLAVFEAPTARGGPLRGFARSTIAGRPRRQDRCREFKRLFAPASAASSRD